VKSAKVLSSGELRVIVVCIGSFPLHHNGPKQGRSKRCAGLALLHRLGLAVGDVADAQAQLIQGRGVLGDSLEAGQEDVGADAIGQACTELIEVKLLISGASSRVRLSIELPYKICVMRENFPDAD